MRGCWYCFPRPRTRGTRPEAAAERTGRHTKVILRGTPWQGETSRPGENELIESVHLAHICVCVVCLARLPARVAKPPTKSARRHDRRCSPLPSSLPPGLAYATIARVASYSSARDI
ncbi:hypothetical protein LY76DRAFT_349170 [Colletotrichum caudatum]|nr:hypothetical protein LY76DRAFT_349170 [Colletotrichum caudatum]